MNIAECFEILELRPDATADDVKTAYKRLMMIFHPDKVQGDPRLKAIAEARSKEINGAREEVIAFLKKGKGGDNQDRIIIGGGESYGKVSDFFDEICSLNGSGGSFHLDLYIAYRAWCAEKGLKVVSVDDLDKALDALKLVAIRKNINGIDSIYWPGIVVIPNYIFYTDELWADEPLDETPDFPDSLQDADNIDDWGEVIF